jgi:hypothetical protein
MYSATVGLVLVHSKIFEHFTIPCSRTFQPSSKLRWPFILLLCSHAGTAVVKSCIRRILFGDPMIAAEEKKY